MPITRPGLRLNENGQCSACVWQSHKFSIDWTSRKKELLDIAAWSKRTTKSSWDCVLGVSGGKDSTWQALYLRDELGMNPLLVQFVSSDGNALGRYNIENLAQQGFTLLSVQPNPKISAILSRNSFLRYGNVHKYAEMALFAIPFRTAITYQIPLVFFGENPALEAGDCNDGEGWDATTIRNNNTLSGHNFDIWLDDEVRESDLIQYKFPEKEELDAWGGRGLFMGYYLNWSGWNNAIFAIQHGMHCIQASRKSIGAFHKHNTLDSDYGGIVNPMLKQIKLGFGNTTEYACYDVRAGRLTREEAALLAKEFDGRCDPKYIKSYCDWINISENLFWDTANAFRGKMWKQDEIGQWALNNPLWEQLLGVNQLDLNAVLRKANIKNGFMGHECNLTKS